MTKKFVKPIKKTCDTNSSYTYFNKRYKKTKQEAYFISNFILLPNLKFELKDFFVYWRDYVLKIVY